jgi:hypothetical protein
LFVFYEDRVKKWLNRARAEAAHKTPTEITGELAREKIAAMA